MSQGQRPSLLPTLAEELSEELHRSNSSRFLMAPATDGSVSSEGNNNNNNNHSTGSQKNRHNSPKQNRTSPGIISLSKFDAGEPPQRQIPPPLTELPRSETLEFPSPLVNPPRRSVSCDSAVASRIQKRASAPSSPQNERWSEEPIQRQPNSLLNRASFTSARNVNAPVGGRHSFGGTNTGANPRFAYGNQRSHSFRRSLSLVERNDGTSLASNITRKSNNIRNIVAKKSTSAFRFNGAKQQDSSRESLDQYKLNQINKRMQAHIGFSVGDAVLIIGNRDDNDARAGMVYTCVNRFGYPPGEGPTLEEQRGPYIYVLGKVTQVHYEENAKFYTVQREDTGVDIRGDADFMEPLLSKEGEEAARRAATEYARGAYPRYDMDEDGLGDVPREGNDKAIRVVENVCVILLLPFIWLYDCFHFIIGARLYRWGHKAYTTIRSQAHLFLNGMSPYECSVQITTVNLVVLCSIWYNFMDQLRLAFFPRESDYPLAVINFGIWTVLVVELIFEVFIRPDGYRKLIRSDKAYTPATVRFISGIHLFVEFVSLAFFVPEFLCLFQPTLTCDGRPVWGFINATMLAVTGRDAIHAWAGRAIFACVRLRVFGLVRHWKSMWLNITFLKRGREILPAIAPSNMTRSSGTIDKLTVDEGTTVLRSEERARLLQKQRDAALINASNIGTALMVTNSYRALIILCAIIGLFPMITLINYKGVANSVAIDLVDQLQQTNKMVTAEDESSCEFLAESVRSWLDAFQPRHKKLKTSNSEEFVVALAIKPARCIDYFEDISSSNMIFTEVECYTASALYDFAMGDTGNCILGSLEGVEGNNLQKIAQNLGLRVGNLHMKTTKHLGLNLEQADGSILKTDFAVAAHFNKTHSIESSALASCILQLFLLVAVLAGLIILREDAKDLVLGPLRSMLKIVARYAKNPLSQGNSASRDNISVVSDLESEFSSHFEDDENSQEDGFGTYETEQLITAVAKITDLLRKCWGVAGADIISTNLASREGALAEVFNPTVPGKSVYALFAFAAINGFDHALKCLGGDVMILINDVANVLHDEVFRWGFGDSGQCNKNLGAAFLMVFRIGLVKEVVEKLEEATKVIFTNSDAKKFNTKRRIRQTYPATHIRRDTPDNSKLSGWHKSAIARNAANPLKVKQYNRQHDAMADAMQLSLQSLPGISTFTDRAVIGMLKSFSGIHRDNKLRAWSRDFRLSAGVGTFSVDMIFGMDAGWAVEGAVGSEYKIDATYLSPHVNMASRMMSACKHYGVTILLSEAVQELMSDVARSKLRNLDRVTVKGSSKIQNIYTYDARHKGADFFLFSRSDEQADMDAERYTPTIWHTDQDLKAMRHHVTEDFESEFKLGMKAYYDGDWPTAIKRLENASEIMVDAAMEEGYLHDELDHTPDRKELYRTETSDGPCSYLVHFMKSKKGVAPPGWAGWHPLLSK